MADIIDLPTVRAHLRLEDDYPGEQLQIYLAAATAAAADFLNRRIFANDTAKAEAIAAVPARLAVAVLDHASAVASAGLIDDWRSREAALADAEASLRDEHVMAFETRRGLEINPAIRAAILLTVGHLFENRENSVSEKLSELPNGCRALLQPYRIGMGV